MVFTDICSTRSTLTPIADKNSYNTVTLFIKMKPHDWVSTMVFLWL